MIWLPSRSPELDAVENIWQYLRRTCFSNTVFENCGDIIRRRLRGLEQLATLPDVITSIRKHERAHIGQ